VEAGAPASIDGEVSSFLAPPGKDASLEIVTRKEERLLPPRDWARTVTHDEAPAELSSHPATENPA
jgi:hypothetical protein